ncbi:NUDIX domain-containing protein [Candidatus Woesearchaeota archaeon]|jgi:8-oxo-dGTP diphosphatase|nr:NUDIX domain-containing protein [Candidatus Woesearchaeota archaeon]MBT4368214.1 NUDIX domain-containing protein [Candidatus Woesearchaeota archaeon]MBT4712703.1 NUDIX domain-containing protein [Candidatus Woesearchaeota archaeon]MBT6639615.1 NUDIX domain-containing protein [Candidatus Woesearchaeota archaeon]MBT7133787.1 NUDIX domain-containing protein [Candidatus Woesearchaeota archaeon]
MEIGFATKAIIFKEEKVLLITKSDKEDINPNTVDIPGGRLEFGETPEDALRREVKEETGIEIEIIKPSHCWTLIKKEKEFQLVGVTFYCKFLSGIETLSEEHTEFKWIDPEQILKEDFPEWLKKEITAALDIKKSLC